MAHDLEILSSGTASMFSVKETPWHGLGVILDQPPTVEEGLVEAGLNWNVSLAPLNTDSGLTVPDHRAVVRDTDSKILGVVGKGWKPLQNQDAFSWFQPWLDSGVATLESAGSLKGGKRVWVMAKIKADPLVIVPGADDTVERYILLSNGHDGTMAIRAGFSAVRVVCQNTLSAAISDSASKLLRVRHSGKAMQALDEIQKVMNVAEAQFQATAEQYRRLAACRVNDADMVKYVQRVFKVTPATTTDAAANDPGDEGDDCSRLINRILPLFEKGRGNDLPGVKGTLWGAMNAVTEYLTHDRGHNLDNRIDSLWFGQGANLTQKAYIEALKMAA